MFKYFEVRRIRQARKHADAGGQALLVPGCDCHWPNAPKCFQGHRYGYLFDRDIQRLKLTASTLGVRVIKVDKPGQPGQHVNLCGKPLQRAIKESDYENQKHGTENSEVQTGGAETVR